MRQWSSLLETADFIGRTRHVELACFSVLGRRAISSTETSVAIFLAGSARAHAWRAVQLEELLPVSLGLPGVEAATRSPGQAIDDAIAALEHEPNDASVVDALGAVLYPAMLVEYRSRIASAHLAADRPLVRTLRRATGDLEAVADELYELRPDLNATAPLAASLAETLSSSGGILGSVY
jgi:hypothetical protein